MTFLFPAGCPALLRRTGVLAAALALALAAAGSVAAQDKDPVVAKVNGVEIHQSDLAVAEEEAGQLPPMTPDAKKDYLVQFMADMILVRAPWGRPPCRAPASTPLRRSCSATRSASRWVRTKINVRPGRLAISAVTVALCCGAMLTR